jgi:hypothetical protein
MYFGKYRRIHEDELGLLDTIVCFIHDLVVDEQFELAKGLLVDLCEQVDEDAYERGNDYGFESNECHRDHAD